MPDADDDDDDDDDNNDDDDDEDVDANRHSCYAWFKSSNTRIPLLTVSSLGGPICCCVRASRHGVSSTVSFLSIGGRGDGVRERERKEREIEEEKRVRELV